MTAWTTISEVQGDHIVINTPVVSVEAAEEVFEEEGFEEPEDEEPEEDDEYESDPEPGAVTCQDVLVVEDGEYKEVYYCARRVGHLGKHRDSWCSCCYTKQWDGKPPEIADVSEVV